MSDVVLAVGGRSYTVACADGEEDHVRDLAAMVDAKLVAMGANLSSLEAKNLLFAALLLADELDEAKRAARAQATAPAPTPAPTDHDGAHLAGRLERIANALENAAATLEGGLESGADPS